jgi:hypothetical protein
MRFFDDQSVSIEQRLERDQAEAEGKVEMKDVVEKSLVERQEFGEGSGWIVAALCCILER